ncbi:MAG: PIN domain-containing protein [Cyanobacteriota bacterium]|nr:PIN domain-containing protein [Cyanobacteriota bacterium]
MISIYVETNYILELSFSQEQAQSCLHLLECCERGAARLVIPAFSIGECFDTLVRRSTQRKRLAETVSVELKQLSRSPAYKSEVPALDSITRLLISSLEDDKRRLDEILTRVLKVAEIVPLDQNVVTKAIGHRDKYGLGYQDSLVFSSVIDHLRSAPSTPSCFLNRNSKDFDDPDIVETFENMDCKMLFSFDKGLNYVNRLLVK